MNAAKIRMKLQTMHNRSFEYAKQIHTVTSFEVLEDEQKFVVKTDLNTFKRKLESAADFFKYWYEQPQNMIMDNVNSQVARSTTLPQLPEEIVKENSLADELVNILKDNIEKVKKNAGYIPQAKAINNNVNSILHVQRLKLQMMAHAKKSRD